MFEFIGFIFWLIYWVFYVGMWLLGAFVVLGLIGMLFAPPQSEEERKFEQEHQKKNADNFGKFLSHGSLNQMLKCSHCDEKGGVRTKGVNERKGISGGKAVGGLLTGGASLLATGISRREKLTKAFCEKCGSSWKF